MNVDLQVTAPDGWEFAALDDHDGWCWCDRRGNVWVSYHAQVGYAVAVETPHAFARDGCDQIRIDGCWVPGARLQAEIVRLARRMVAFGVTGFQDWLPADGGV